MSIESYMAADLAALFTRDMPAECKIGAKTFSVLIDDLLNEEDEAYGGGESVSTQRVHFLVTDKREIDTGSKLAVRQKAQPGAMPDAWETKIVISSIRSADGNELIATVRGD
jgi:hypothetical protein